MKNTLTKKSSQSPVFPTSFREPVPFGFFSLSSSLSLSRSSFFWHIPRQKCSGSSTRQHAVSNASRKNAPKSTSFVVTKEKTVRYGFQDPERPRSNAEPSRCPPRFHPAQTQGKYRTHKKRLRQRIQRHPCLIGMEQTPRNLHAESQI